MVGEGRRGEGRGGKRSGGDEYCCLLWCVEVLINTICLKAYLIARVPK